MNYILSDHTQEEMVKRNVTAEEIDAVMQHPQQILPAKKGRKTYQSLLVRGNKIMMLRLIVDDRTDPAVVVTIYPTTKAKYWRQS
ncbi:MAG TPA: DUF4258 domain-containing protein [Chthonomonadaceae bacterium]|nr:DUF4258 domain-containing protein [Chthonomonadaceae bacterium]